jgi:hypothetical protein
MLVKPEEYRKKGRPRIRWINGVDKNLRDMGLVNWKTKAQERDGWRKYFRLTKVSSANNNDNNNSDRLRAWRPGFSSRQGQKCFLHNVMTASGAHPAAYKMGSKGKAAGT